MLITPSKLDNLYNIEGIPSFMKFAHMSDCHIGSWQRTARLSDASIIAFSRAMDICVEEKVDFILISGDLFDTSLPAVDKLKEATTKLKEMKDKGIPVYIIAGSHDYSPTGKTMLDVLERAGLLVNVSSPEEEGDVIRLKFTVDGKTGAKITGLLGKKGGLEKLKYSKLDNEELEKEGGFKIFMLHSGIEEYKPKHLEQMEAIPLANFPKGFDYYAAGHIHHVFSKDEPGYGLIAFPGPLFPNNFDELEKLGNGGFYIVEANGKVKLNYIPVPVHNFASIIIDCNGKTPREVENELASHSRNREFVNTIAGIRLFGTIKEGKTTDINFKEAFNAFYAKGAQCVLKNTYALTSEFFEEVKTSSATAEDVEDAIIKENIKGSGSEKEIELAKTLIHSLSMEKDEGERSADFESRVIESVAKALDIKL